MTRSMLTGPRLEIPPMRGNQSIKLLQKWCGEKNRLKPVWLTALGLMLAGHATAQTFKLLYSFSAGKSNSSGSYANSDGGSPQAGLALSGNTLYGTAYEGGSSANGTIFAVNADGTGFTNMHNFSGSPGDGASPLAS